VIAATLVNAVRPPSIHMVRKGGLVVFFGNVPKSSITELDCNLIYYNNIWIRGVIRMKPKFAPSSVVKILKGRSVALFFGRL